MKSNTVKIPRRIFLKQSSFLGLMALLTSVGYSAPRGTKKKSFKRVTLAKPGPMILPVPAILLTVKGKPGDPDEISVVWTFVVNGEPPQIGISVHEKHIAGGLVKKYGQFVLNVPTADSVRPFDIVDMNSHQVGDKFALSGLTRGKAIKVNVPTVEESPIPVECKVFNTIDIPPNRTLSLAEVVATTVHEGVCDENGRLNVDKVPFFGMTAGSGEFYTMGKKVGHIGQSKGRNDIKY